MRRRRILWTLLLVVACAREAAAEVFPDLIEMSHALPGWSWVADRPRVEVGYARPYDLPELHASHLRLRQGLGRGLGVTASLEVLRAGAVDHRRPALELRARAEGHRVGVRWSRETVEVQGHQAEHRPQLDFHLRWQWEELWVAGRWDLRSDGGDAAEPAMRLVLAWVDPRWAVALRRRPSPWRAGGVWDGGLRARVGSAAALGLRLREEDAALHLDWQQGRRRIRFAFTLDGPRARGLALAVEWGR